MVDDLHLSHPQLYCEGTSMMYGMYVCSPMLIPRQLKFSLYSGAVITEGRCSLFTSLL